MANIRIGYNNHCLESGVTFTPSTEAAAHDADNLGKAHPAKFWRMTTTERQTLTVTFPGIRQFDTVAVLYATATPHKQVFKFSGDFTNAAWVKTGLDDVDIVEASTTLTTAGGEVVRQWVVPEDTSTGLHRIRQADISKLSDDTPTAFAIEVYARAISAARHLRLYLEGTTTGDQAQAKFNLTTGAVDSSSVAGNVTAVDTAISSFTDSDSNTVYRCQMIALVDGDSGNLDDAMIDILDGSLSSSYTGVDGEGLLLYAAKLEYAEMASSSTIDVADVRDNWIESQAGTGAVWSGPWATAPSSYEIGQFGSGATVYRHFSRRADEQAYKNARGWVHSADSGLAAVRTSSAAFKFHDPANAGGQLDISNIYIGETWSPAKNLHEDWSWEIDPETGARTLMLRILYASEAEAKADAIPMALTAGVGIKSAAVADGGQEFRRDRKPILVILDPDEATYAQEDMVYGFLDEFRVKAHKYVANMDGAGNSGLAYAIEMKIKEVLP